MIDPAIQTFLTERKESWLKKKVDSKTTAEQESELTQEANEKFALDNWLPDAAKRAKRLSLVSHPAKFSHPSAKTSSVVAIAAKNTDGFVRTGNTLESLDVFGDAAAMDVYKFLSLVLVDGQTVLSHLEQQTSTIQQQFTLSTANYAELAPALLAIKATDTEKTVTSAIVKQVYFPVAANDYHLLSVLTPSSLMFSLKKRINAIRFPDDEKAKAALTSAREARKENKSYEGGYSEIYSLTVIGFGGTKPQNISVLNSQNYGTAYLLESLPPIFKKRNINPPKSNFFSSSLRLKDFQEDFDALHKQLSSDINNIHVKKKLEWMIKNIIYQVADKLWQIRYLDAGWSTSDNYQNLPQPQKIWLDQAYQDTRQQQTDWQDDIKTGLARWLANSYKETQGDKALSIDDDRYKPHFIRLIEECEVALL
ncbi:type I-F CRISPR-associated protein Csy1 [Crenothrix sp. D3]|nr:type I-F CRISPR-associated protein Csy1 [Crenothrix sp. D3]